MWKLAAREFSMRGNYQGRPNDHSLTQSQVEKWIRGQKQYCDRQEFRTVSLFE
jgi:hypothetical protein